MIIIVLLFQFLKKRSALRTKHHIRLLLVTSHEGAVAPALKRAFFCIHIAQYLCKKSYSQVKTPCVHH